MNQENKSNERAAFAAELQALTEMPPAKLAAKLTGNQIAGFWLSLECAGIVGGCPILRSSDSPDMWGIEIVNAFENWFRGEPLETHALANAHHRACQDIAEKASLMRGQLMRYDAELIDIERLTA